MRRLVFLILFLFFLFGNIYSQEVLSVDDCISIALKRNAQLNNARYNLGISRANKLGSLSSILPRFSVSFSSRQNKVSTSTYLRDTPVIDTETKKVIGYKQEEVTTRGYDRNFHYANFNWNQTIYDGGAWWNRIKKGNTDLDAAKFNLESAIISTITLVQQRYLELLKEIKQLEVYEKSVKSAEEQLHRTESMYKIGSVAQADVFRARVNLGNEKINYLKQKNIIEAAKANLNIAMGKNPNEEINIDVNAFENVKVQEINISLEEAIQKALDSNPELKSLSKNMESSELAVKIAKSNRIPTIGAQIGYSRSNSLFKRVYADFDKNYSWNFSGQISFNIFDGFQTKSSIRREQESALIAKENYESRKRTLANEVKQAYNNYMAYKEIMKLNEENVKSAEEDLRLAQERYRVGAGTLLETIDAQVNLTKARTMYVRTKYDLLIYLSQLKNLIGMVDEKYYDMAEFKR